VLGGSKEPVKTGKKRAEGGQVNGAYRMCEDLAAVITPVVSIISSDVVFPGDVRHACRRHRSVTAQ